MGKIADNERIKLKATFCNNVAAGSLVGGAAVPYVSFFQKIASHQTFSLTTPSEWSAIGAAILIAFAIAIVFRWEANSEIKKITD